MKLEGSCESVEKMEKLLTKGFPARLIKDGSKPFLHSARKARRV